MDLISKHENIMDVLSIFYGRRYKTTQFFTYLCVDTCISLIKTNKWFYKFKKILYNLIIVRLSRLHGIYRSYDPNYSCSPEARKQYYSIVRKLNNNKSLENKTKIYLSKIYFRILMLKHFM